MTLALVRGTKVRWSGGRLQMAKQLGDSKSTSTPVRQVRSIPASPFVGREEELQRLAAALALASHGKGGVIFLTGEPGIGKTRLAREALAVAKERGFTILDGRAYPLEVGLAYAPLVDAFRPLIGKADPARLKSLAGDLPSLGHLFEGLRLPPSVLAMEGLDDPALEKTRLFEAISRFFERLTQEAPVTLFIDDLHWADSATLELLHYLARGLSDQAGLILASYRAGSMDSAHRLRELVEPLQRAGLADEMALYRLKPDASHKLIRGILGGDAPNGLLSLLDARAGGTPLFIEALIDALIQSGKLKRSTGENDGWVLNPDGATGLPQNVRRLILERLDRLATIERRVLDLLAIMGDATSHAILRTASDLEEETILGALRRLRVVGLVADGIDGLDVTYSITHPLIQEVAYAELPEMERRRAHLTAIKAIESLAEGQQNAMSRLARHYLGAGSEADSERALAALVAAGERALLLCANEEAARHFEAALAIARRRGLTESLADREEPLLPWLLDRLGEALERVGRPEAAVDVWDEALVERERAGDAVGAARLHSRLALVEWDRGQFDIAKRP
ncbi:MAG: AAA family ATPase [Dehalococcoidia bacterium]|nr:AAA family ATPase [Dehalococcoidia bacterium]